ncbi:ectoine utilization protein EutC [Labrys monachus]|uniref:Ornithine cyclodeaminase n=1 Tax=Labrys monachus TaxID=217067 RepID=A0ABU0FBB4_9HYPH|nr:ectoine utilization protein EutC [Labrys monachus]MDQ0391900.1 ornithine cyclodeaminase [Labrys monachus]
MIILTESDLRRIVPLDADAVACVEEAFLALATKAVAMPPILRLDIPEHRGEVDVKTAYVPGLDGFAIKVSPGFFDNPKLGLPSLNGLMILFSARTGLVEALLLDNGYLTQMRTAAAGAVAARHLARTDARRAAILGAGEQARLQLEALTLVRPIERAAIWARDPERARAAAAELTQRLGIVVEAVATAETACAGADIIVTATPAERPILEADWLVPGQHVTAMGSDAEHKNEIDPAVFLKAVYVADSLSQTRRLGELAYAIRAGMAGPDEVFAEIGQVIAGQAPGRRSDADITLCDLTGTGVQDTAIATLAHRRALAAGAGRIFETTDPIGGTA